MESELSDTFHHYPSNNEHFSKSKKIKTKCHDYSIFQEGSIIKIRLENFVTYSLTEFHLSSSLNMIIGPNGSGKSTFVCAICLGLGGKPEFIGRAKKVEDFIKNGTDESIIEITLKNSSKIIGFSMINNTDDSIKIKRIISKSKKKSNYFINNCHVSEIQVKTLVTCLNIQLDNLCQFLSQERVEEFARLKPNKLLEETMRSIDSSLLEILRTLQLLQSNELDEIQDINSNKKKLNGLVSKRTSLQKQVHAMQEYERKKKEIEIHKKLLPYVRIKNHKQQLVSLKVARDDAKKQLKSFLKDKQPYRIASEKLLLLSNEYLQLKDLKEQNSKELKAHYNTVISDLRKVKNEIEDKKGRIKYYKNRNIVIKQKISDEMNNLNAEKSNLSALDFPSDEEISVIESNMKDLKNKYSNIKEQIYKYQIQADDLSRDLSRFQLHLDKLTKELTSNDPIRLLEGKNQRLEELKRVVEYIRSTPEMKDKVLEPPILTVSTTSPKFASYLSSVVDFGTSVSITMVGPESYNRFNSILLGNFNVNLRELLNKDIKYPFSREYIRSLGFEGYLSDFIKGNPDVIKMLCQQQNINTIPVSRKEIDPKIIEELKKPDHNGQLKFRRIISGNYIYDFKQSSYGSNQIFFTEFQVRKSEFYMDNVMPDESKTRIIQQINELQDKYTQRKSERDEILKHKSYSTSDLDSIMSKLNDYKNKLGCLNKKRKVYSALKVKIENSEQKLNDLNNSLKKDVSIKVTEHENAINVLFKNQNVKMSEIIRLIDEIRHSRHETIEMEIKLIDTMNRERSLNDIIGLFKSKEQELKVEFEEKESAYITIKQTPEFKQWMHELRSYSDGEKEELSKWANEYEKNGIFTLTEIKERISKGEMEMSIMNHDESAITELKEVESEIEHINGELPYKIKKLEKIQQEILNNRQTLEPKLDDIISKISRRFQHLFSNVGSAGEVQLAKPDSYSEWEILIMVKFRDNAPLKQLGPHVQSGGERAVSTVLYMIALQEFTTAPFRVVDEINQGMDTRNERIVHKAMVENACIENTSQYFLITPKLLTGLYYHQNMRIHCVFAGSWIPDPIKEPEKLHYGETTQYNL